jgi:hypothetical protein
VERLAKWNGHLLNRYDTKTLHAALSENRIDGGFGNLAGCQIALSRG